MVGTAGAAVTDGLGWVGGLTLFGLRALRDAFRPPFEVSEMLRQIYEVGWRSLPLIAAADQGLRIRCRFVSKNALLIEMDQQLNHIVLSRRVVAEPLQQVIPDFLDSVQAVAAPDKLVGLLTRAMLLSRGFIDEDMPVAAAIMHLPHFNFAPEARAPASNAIP